VPLFPPATPVTVLVDGHPLAAYERAYVAGGRVFAPVSPLLTRLADRVWFEGDTLVVERGTRRVRIPLAPASAGQLGAAYVMVGPVLRALGASVRYEPALRRVTVSTPLPAAVASPTPFNPGAPSVSPSAVFTPAEPATARPVWTGSPLPRRSALPLPSPRSLGAGKQHNLSRHAVLDALVRVARGGEREARGDG
jgi:hypothetical protein